ncbi:MAG: D-alanyl-D-alanine carboxypeptidase family protein [Clostridia bacterium]|nr:D-alanyl-D-alanine carboxypeptidase family protein [Clostridia bacterium]
MKKHIKKIIFSSIIFLIILSFLFPIFFLLKANATYNSQHTFKSEIVYLENLDQNTVIFDKNADKKTAPASLVKILLAAIVIENQKDLNKEITAKKELIDSLLGTNSSTAGIRAGEVLTVEQLLYSLLIRSGNDAALILADDTAGSIDAFVNEMNKYAKNLGCKNSHFTNVHGLDEDGNYTTARDMAKITKHALNMPEFKKITSLRSYTLPATNKRPRESVFGSTNLMLFPYFKYYYRYASGVKTGTTTNAGKCLISTASKNGYNYLSIVMRAPFDEENSKNEINYTVFKETIDSFEWAFNNIRLKNIAGVNDFITDVPIRFGRKKDRLRLLPKEEVNALIPKDADPSSVIIVPADPKIEVKAPIKKGQTICDGKIMYANNEVSTIELVAGESVQVSFFAFVGYYLKKFFSSTLGKIIFVLILLAILSITGLIVLVKRKKEAETIKIVRINRK